MRRQVRNYDGWSEVLIRSEVVGVVKWQIIGRAKRAPHWGVQSRFRVIYVGMYVCRGPKSVGGNTWAKRAHAQSQYWANPTSNTRIINFDYTL